MPTPSPCVPCCTTPQPVNVPGIEGQPGGNGTNGQNAFTTLTSSSAVPNAVGDQITIAVLNALWMVIGQIVVIAGPSTYEVISVNNSNSVTLQWLQYSSDVAPNTVIASGSGISPAGVAAPGLSTLTVYGSGTAYSLTNAQAQIVMGTISPALAITAAGTWLLLCRARLDYAGATFAAVRTATLKIRRTNNTAADVANSSAAFLTEIITTKTFTAKAMEFPALVYVTANNNDALEMWAGIDVVPSAGSLDVVEASIVAVRIA